MALKARRKKRYNRLIKNGFLRFEAKPISKVPLTLPYVKEMFKERRLAYKAYKAKSRKEKKLIKGGWKGFIRQMYIDEGFLKKDKSDPWQMLRSWEDKYKDQHPEYQSPQKPRKPKVKRKDEVVSKYAKGLEAYERGRYR